MKFNKQVFWRLIAVFAILDLIILTTGCADWESQASSIITLLGPAIQSLVAILAAFGVGASADVTAAFNNWAQQAQTALVNLKALVASYKTAAASEQPGILGEIEAGAAALTSNLAPIMASLHITDPGSQAKFAAAVAAVTDFLTALAALIPAVTTAKSITAERALGAKAEESKKTFRSAFNAAAGYFGKQYTV